LSALYRAGLVARWMLGERWMTSATNSRRLACDQPLQECREPHEATTPWFAPRRLRLRPDPHGEMVARGSTGAQTRLAMRYSEALEPRHAFGGLSLRASGRRLCSSSTKCSTTARSRCRSPPPSTFSVDIERRSSTSHIYKTPFLVPREQDDHLFFTTISRNSGL
jgi:hypothetical protein